MIPMMVEELAATGTAETREELAAHVEEFVMRLNGRQTIYQMIQLADEVRARGGQPLEPISYKHRYHNLLWAQIADRVAGLREGRFQPDDWTVPHSRRLLQVLSSRKLALYLASGTDLQYVRDELAVLRLEHYFAPHIYGALDNYQDFSKAKIVRQILEETGMSGEELLGFGDGFVEIEEIRRAGGVAIGVASEEETRRGVNAWKRERLIRAGADVIIGDYGCLNELLGVLGI
jgi:beta-phosphoglucomutase-like phosphatase (HAD superfamily)